MCDTMIAAKLATANYIAIFRYAPQKAFGATQPPIDPENVRGSMCDTMIAAKLATTNYIAIFLYAPQKAFGATQPALDPENVR